MWCCRTLIPGHPGRPLVFAAATSPFRRGRERTQASVLLTEHGVKLKIEVFVYFSQAVCQGEPELERASSENRGI